MSAAATRAARDPRSAAVPLRRRRSTPHLLAGAVLVVAAALGAALLVARLDTRVPVLVVTRDVQAGQVLTNGDVAVVRVVADPGVRTVPAGRRDGVVGRAAAVPLVAGALLAPGQVGPAAWPPVGRSVVSVAVRAGRTPAGLARGGRVSVLVLPQLAVAAAGSGTGTADAQVVRAEATVVAVQPGEDQPGTTVVSLLLADDAATRVASASGDVALVVRAPGR